MPGKKVTDIENVHKAALLASRGETPRDIAGILRVSEPTVSRLLRDARDKKVLTLECNLPPSEIRALEVSLQPEKLRKHLDHIAGTKKHRLKNVKVVDTLRLDRTMLGQVFAAEVARYLLNYVFPKSKQLGVAWGENLFRISQEVHQQLKGSDFQERLNVFPVVGDPPQVGRTPEWSASNIAALLDSAFNGNQVHENSLTGVAASVPEEYLEEEVKAIFKFFREIAPYDEVFGGRKPGLVDRIDCFLTGVGTTASKNNPLFGANSKGALQKFLKRTTFGNIGGIFLKRPNLSPKDASRLDALGERWTGIQLKHVEKLARRSSEKNQPGVVVVANSGKREVVEQCVRLGLINQLIANTTLSAEILAPRPRR